MQVIDVVVGLGIISGLPDNGGADLRVGAGKDATCSSGIDMDHIVQNRVFCLAGKAKILHKTQMEAVCCLRLIKNIDLTTFRHHHMQILFQFMRRMVKHCISTQLFDRKHIAP